MHEDLTSAFNKLVEILKDDTRCLGGWHFGSKSRGLEDIYSDYDPVFLIEGKYFEDFSNDIQKYFSKISDELIIFWAEDFNDNKFKNICSILSLGGNLHQMDIFIVNYDYPDEWMSKLHSKGCSQKDIIFDRTGETTIHLDKSYTVDNFIPDTVMVIDTYLFHAVMLVKYFKRNDIFKLHKNIDILFHAHIDLFLSYYDKLDWGSWENKIKYCVPNEKQEYLKAYFVSADINSLRISVKKCLNQFVHDANEICMNKNIAYSENKIKRIIEYLEREIL
jgi:hypothetical protein